MGQRISDEITLAGPDMIGIKIEEGTVLETPPIDRVTGSRISPTQTLDLATNYTISSPDDPNYSAGRSPSAVYRKTRPANLAYPQLGNPHQPLSDAASFEHLVYLVLAPPLSPGKAYTVAFNFNSLGTKNFTFTWGAMRSDAVHATHVGFRPDDPSKMAYLSLWTGSGGAKDFTAGNFHICSGDNTFDCGDSNYRVFTGPIGAPFPKETAENSPLPDCAVPPNYSFTDVYPLDFSAWPNPSEGIYRVCVENVGCSYPFRVSPNLWQNLFFKSVRGLYFQRSGIAVGTPEDLYQRPADFTGIPVKETDATLLEAIFGLTDIDPYTWLSQNEIPGTTVSGAWGGYHDAGDWQRRIDHVRIGRLLFELYEAFPARFQSLNLNLPITSADPVVSPPLPDLIREGLWSVDFFKRLQSTDAGELYGAVRGCIIPAALPSYGERSFEVTSSPAHNLLACHPDVWSTYLYAAAAAGAYSVLKKYGSQISFPLLVSYLKSALDAMAWAEKESSLASSKVHWDRAQTNNIVPLPFPDDEVRNARNLAAAELFRATGDLKWHTIFTDTTLFTTVSTYADGYTQADAAWVYYNTDLPGMSLVIKGRCGDVIVNAGDLLLSMQLSTGFRLGKNFYTSAGLGNLTGADQLLTNVVRAHGITKSSDFAKSEDFLKSLVLSSQPVLGANPLNISYTTAVGHKYPLHLFHYDSRGLQDPPPGITAEGPLDALCNAPIRVHYNSLFAPYVYPGSATLPYWPAMEAYADSFWFPHMSEFQVNQTVLRTAYLWGYLAALRGFQPSFTRSLSVTRTGTGTGRITSTPSRINCGSTCSGAFTDWAQVALTAVPDTGSTFSGWGGGGTGTYKLIMDGDAAATASFTLIPYQVSGIIQGDGAISAAGLECSGATCSGTYPYGTTISLTASPGAGSAFSGWTGCDTVSTGAARKGAKNPFSRASRQRGRAKNAVLATNQCTVTVTGEKSVTAIFVPLKTVNVGISGSGIVKSSPSGIDCTSTCSQTFVKDTMVSLSATPATGFAFAYWLGACSGASPSCSVTASDDLNVHAVFDSIKSRKYRLTVAIRKPSSGEGSVISTDGIMECEKTCSGVYFPDTPVALVALAGDDSVFTGWTGACSGVGVCSIAMNKAKTVIASFSGPQKLVLAKRKIRRGNGTVTSAPPGIACETGCVSTSSNYLYKSQVTLSATPDGDSIFTGWRPASLECPGSGDCTVTMDRRRDVTAVFTKK
jgi:endoglucanase